MTKVFTLLLFILNQTTFTKDKIIIIKNNSQLENALERLEDNTLLVLDELTLLSPITINNKNNITIIGRELPFKKPILDFQQFPTKTKLIRNDLPFCKPDSLLPECEWKEECQCDWFPQYPNPQIKSATIQIINSRNIRIKNLKLINGHPTHISILNSKNISISRNDFLQGSFAIFAQGEETSGLTIKDNKWIQDTSIDNDLWKRLDWKHAHHGLYHHLNGAFFGSINIAGNVLIRNNDISDAFNAIRMNFKPDQCQNISCPRHINRDVSILHNRFTRIRDNILEPEWILNGRWIFAHNTILNAHADISLDTVNNPDHLGYLLIYKNHFTKTSRPSLNSDNNIQIDKHNGGKIFKLAKRTIPIYSESTTPKRDIPFLSLIVQNNYFDTFVEEDNYQSSFLKGKIPEGTNLENWGNNQLEGNCRINGEVIQKREESVCSVIEDLPSKLFRPPVNQSL